LCVMVLFLRVRFTNARQANAPRQYAAVTAGLRWTSPLGAGLTPGNFTTPVSLYQSRHWT
jgi:hypothetical protein